MKLLQILVMLASGLALQSTWASSEAINQYKALTALEGDWVLSPAEQQEGGTTKKGPAAEIVGTDTTAMSFKVIGKGSTLQENLLPGTGKEMATMYHCNDFKNCTQVMAKHYCAKQNQPEFVFDQKNSNENIIAMTCDMNSPLCNSSEGHIHMIRHELSQNNTHLKTTYTTFKDGKYKKDSIYHFDRKF